MDYRITCVCGHPFLVPGDKLHAPVTCPACHQVLSPVVEASKPATPAALQGGSGDPQPASAQETKQCPFCGEVILAIARKCKHCGEFLDRGQPAFPAAPASSAVTPANAPAPPPGHPADVPPVYALSVSQWDNFWKYLILLTIVVAVGCALYLIPPLKPYKEVGTMGTAVLGLFIGWFFYLSVRSTRIFVRTQRVDTERGVLSKDLNSLELFRITNMELEQGLIERLLGIGTVKLMTADDPSNPEMILYQIPHAREVFKYIQNQIPLAAKARGAVYMEK